MLNGYKRSGTALFAARLMPDIMQDELDELYFEQHAELTIEHLLKRIAVLESCNAALCCKLALIQMDPAVRQPASRKKIAKSNDRRLKLCVMDNPLLKPTELLREFHVNGHACTLPAPRMMKKNTGAVRI